MKHKQYHQMEPQSPTYWTRCGTKFSCNGDCPNKGERVDMEPNQVVGKEITDRLNNPIGSSVLTIPQEKYYRGHDCQHEEQTSFGKKSKLMIAWDDDLSEEDIDWLQSFVNLQIKKIRRMCKIIS